MSVRSNAGRGATGRATRLLAHPPRGEFFSLGGVLAPYARTPESLTPWLLSAAVLLALASWDPLTTGGRFDAILFGLAAYELLIGLIRSGERQTVRVAASEARQSGSTFGRPEGRPEGRHWHYRDLPG